MDGYVQKSGEKKITNKKKKCKKNGRRYKETQRNERWGGPSRERERGKKNIPNASKERERKTQRAVEKEMY
jgi:hypothetical protein